MNFDELAMMNSDQSDDFSEFFIRYIKASKIARELMLVCEVEKIWIINNLSVDGYLRLSQLHTYFKQFKKQPPSFTEKIFKQFDLNSDGKFQKDEISNFLKAILEQKDF